MIRLANPRRFTTGHGTRLWPVVALLSLVVLLPSATVLWLARAAISNEREVIQGRLQNAYQGQLRLAVAKIDQHWAEVDRSIAELSKGASGAELFQRCIQAGFADSVIVYDEDGRIAYPQPINGSRVTVTAARPFDPQAWTLARRFEFVEKQFGLAADAYQAIANVEPDPNFEARAWMAHARCLTKDSKPTNAMRVYTDQLGSQRLKNATDEYGRSIWLDGQLCILDRSDVDQFSDPASQSQLTLRRTLEDYGRPIPSSQRIFAMKRYLATFPDEGAFETLAAEQLATVHASGEGSGNPPALWRLRDASNCVAMETVPVVLLFGEHGLRSKTEQLLTSWRSDEYAIQLESEGSDHHVQSPETIATMPLPSLPGRMLTMQITKPETLIASARSQTAIYSLAGLLTIAIAGLAAIAITWFVRKQLRVAQLKNDLAAVVSHELRTPLASTRVLVDTLLDSEESDQSDSKAKHRRVEYLQLISRENERLSRLIETFLTYSRLQRGNPSFDFKRLDPVELSHLAISAARARLDTESRSFRADIADPLPAIDGDHDAMLNVLVNLLDNAVKFSGETGSVDLRVREQGQTIEFEVADNGIGMSPAESRQAFDRFYQADAKLSRSHGGCGLGLNLVQSIVEAHRGRIDVDSEPNVGTTFRIQIPVAPREEPATTRMMT